MNSSLLSSEDVQILCFTLSLYGLSSLYTYFSLFRQTSRSYSSSILNTSSHSHNTNRVVAQSGSNPNFQKGTRSGRHGGREDYSPPLALYASADESIASVNTNQNSASGSGNANQYASLGENMRNYIIMFLTVSQVMRWVCILLEYYAYYHSHTMEPSQDTRNNDTAAATTTDQATLQQNYEITSIVAHTLPFQSFAITYAGLVLFYHGIVSTLSATLNTGTTSTKDHTGGQESQQQFYSSSQTQSNYNIHSQSSNQQSKEANPRQQKNLVPAHGKIHSRLERIYRYGYGAYFFFIVMNCIIPVLDSSTLQIILNVYFSIWFSVLWIALIFFGGRVMFALKKTIWNATGSILFMTTTNESKFVNASAKHLGLKMICLTFVCSLGFLGRAFIGAIAAMDTIHGNSSWENVCEHKSPSSNGWTQSFLFTYSCSSKLSANMIGYILLEWIPALTAVFVLKKHSITHNKFQTQNESVSQFITRRPITLDRDAIIIGLEAGQGQGLPRVGSHGGANHGLADKSRSYSATIGAVTSLSRGNPGARSHTHITPMSSVGGSNMKRSNSGVASSETKALLGGQKINTHSSITSYGGL